MVHSGKRFRIHPLIIFGPMAIFLVLALFPWVSASASASDDVDVEVYGRIDNFPAGLLGDWSIDGISYRADENSQFKQEAGPFSTDKCVKVAYLPDAIPLMVREIETEADSDCDSETERPGSESEPGDETTVRGFVESLPSPGLTGIWRIDGVEYLADGSTEFKQDHGPFVGGACVEIQIRTTGNPSLIEEIETEEIEDCQDPSTATPEDPGTPDDELETYGRIGSFPAGFTGDWIINGVTYVADLSTEFEQEHGPFAVEACVKIHVKTSTTPPTLREIGTEHDFRCGIGATLPSTPEAKLFGVIQGFPQGLIGAWNIGGMTITSDGNTKFEQEEVPFKIGVTVKAHFVDEEDGTHRALEIESQFETDDNDENRNGEFEGAEGHAFGTIDSFPDGLIGDWEIGGMLFKATDLTRFQEEDGSFANGAQVRIDYLIREEGRIARKIETTHEDGDVSDVEHAKVFGFVRAMPANGFVGTWTIDDAEFVTSASSKFDEAHGLLAMGSFVSIEYSLKENQRVIHELEAHVPPGAGSVDSVGTIDGHGAILSASITAPDSWTIGGLAYQIVPATSLDDSEARLDIGTTVIVNSYDGGSGRIATQVRAIVIDEVTFVPWISR